MIRQFLLLRQLVDSDVVIHVSMSEYMTEPVQALVYIQFQSEWCWALDWFRYQQNWNAGLPLVGRALVRLWAKTSSVEVVWL